MTPDRITRCQKNTRHDARFADFDPKVVRTTLALYAQATQEGLKSASAAMSGYLR